MSKHDKIPNNLPKEAPFEGLKPVRQQYRYLGFRPPKKGEYYLSGAVVQAWKAPNDLTTAFYVVEPLSESKP